MKCPYFLRNLEQKKTEKENVKSYLIQLEKEHEKSPKIIINTLVGAMEAFEKRKNPRRIKSKIEHYLKSCEPILSKGLIPTICAVYPPYERTSLTSEQIIENRRWELKNKINNIFQVWKTQAHPILKDILQKSGSKIEGLEFEANCPLSNIAYTSGLIGYRVHMNQDGTYNLDYWDSAFPEHPISNKCGLDEILFEMFRGLISLYTHEPFNQRRNKLVKAIEQKTGRNLKREVLAFRKIK